MLGTFLNVRNFSGFQELFLMLGTFQNIRTFPSFRNFQSFRNFAQFQELFRPFQNFKNFRECQELSCMLGTFLYVRNLSEYQELFRVLGTFHSVTFYYCQEFLMLENYYLDVRNFYLNIRNLFLNSKKSLDFRSIFLMLSSVHTVAKIALSQGFSRRYTIFSVLQNPLAQCNFCHSENEPLGIILKVGNFSQ